MGGSGCFVQTQEDCAFNHCLARFRDSNGNPSTINTAYYVIPDSPFGPTSISSTILNNDTDMIVGIVVSVIVITISVLVILVLMYRRKYSNERLLQISAIRRGDRYTINMNQYETPTGTLDIERFPHVSLTHVDNTKNRTKADDTMHIPSAVNHSNTSYHDESIEASNEMYANTCTVTLENKHLDSNEIDEGTRSDDPLHTTHAVDTDKTNYKSKTEISTEGYSKDEPTKETLANDKKTVDSVYEPLDNDSKDKTPKAFDKLHAAFEVDTDSNDYYLNTRISSDKQRNYDPIEETDEMKNQTLTTDY
ncbi:uncharacterized protein LOC143054247 [Mytilus galloprovincialis]|uniref:uncharacterized protein LOC143054247 n=1 Tax=Mytilus galloprovincialis TaxID=29158 RepID=UPI003F7C13E2